MGELRAGLLIALTAATADRLTPAAVAAQRRSVAIRDKFILRFLPDPLCQTRASDRGLLQSYHPRLLFSLPFRMSGADPFPALFYHGTWYEFRGPRVANFIAPSTLIRRPGIMAPVPTRPQ